MNHTITQTCMSKETLDKVLHYLMKQWIKDLKMGTVRPDGRHPFFVFQYYKAFQVKNRLIIVSPRGKALCLLKTQFAKKPKNPV